MPLMALDVGSKRIGVALADPSGTFALPIAVLRRSNIRADLDAVAAILKEYDVREVVVGDPLRLSGERGPASENMDRFVERLSNVFTGTIHRVDERLTTAQAQRSLIASDVSRRKRKTAVDKMAAALILETFLARRRNLTEE